MGLITLLPTAIKKKGLMESLYVVEKNTLKIVHIDIKIKNIYIVLVSFCKTGYDFRYS